MRREKNEKCAKLTSKIVNTLFVLNEDKTFFTSNEIGRAWKRESSTNLLDIKKQMPPFHENIRGATILLNSTNFLISVIMEFILFVFPFCIIYLFFHFSFLILYMKKK